MSVEHDRTMVLSRISMDQFPTDLRTFLKKTSLVHRSPKEGAQTLAQAEWVKES